MLNIRRFYFSNILLWGLVALGIVLLLMQYLFNRSLWHDEASLALNILEKSPAELLQPLDDNQAAPPGFLLTEKILVQIFGGSEYVLRVFPLLCGIASLILFLYVSRHVLPPAAVPMALGLFAISGKFIYYASEVKQYAGDVTVALLLYIIVLHTLVKQPTSFRIGLFGIIGSCVLWFSYPGAFVFAGIVLVVGIGWWREKAWKQINALAVACVIWFISFGMLYFFFLRNTAGNEKLQEYWIWADAFMPLPPTSVADLMWFVRTFLGTIAHALEFSRPFVSVLSSIKQALTGLFSSSDMPVYELMQLFFSGIAWIALYVIAVVILIAGGLSIYSRKPSIFWCLAGPIGLTLLTSGLRAYPFADRLTLFIMPALFIFWGAGIVRIWSKTRKMSPFIGLALIGVLWINPVSFHFIYPRTRIETRPVIQYMQQHWQEEDVVYVYYNSLRVFGYYSRLYGFHDAPYLPGTRSTEGYKNYIYDIRQLHGHSRVWLIFSDAYGEEGLFLAHLDNIGTQRDALQSIGASVYLYDLAPEKGT